MLLVDPCTQLAEWIEDARAAGVPLPDTCTLATSTATGEVSARTIWPKQVDERGIVFTTQGATRKTDDLSANPRCAMTYFWPTMGRQVRVAGNVEVLPAAERDSWFASRPPAHRIASVLSPQGEPIEVSELEALRRAVADGEGDTGTPREGFTAYLVTPDVMEFWTHADDRLHERREFRRDGAWSERLLAP